MDKVKEIVTKLKVLFNAQLTEDEKKVMKDYAVKLEEALAPPAPEMTTGKLKDGTVVQYEGELKEGSKLMVVTEDAGSVDAPDGTHELESGVKVSTIAGLVTKIEAPTETPAPAMEEQMKATFSAHKTALEKTIETKFAAEKETLLKEITELKKVQLSTLNAINKMLEVPFDTILEKQKPQRELTEAEKYRLNNPV
jgi:DNA-binding Xre family transcriptional regulator